MKKIHSISALVFALPLLAASMNASAERFQHNRLPHFAGAVFTQTNAAAGNQVLMYGRDSRGDLKFYKAFPTLGAGTGGGLGNQGALALSDNGRWLFVVNAGSNEISVFEVSRVGLTLVDKISSGGLQPVSLTLDHDLLYVLNAGSDTITGFNVTPQGALSPLPNSTRSLSGSGTGPAQVEFSPHGDVLVVTEKATNQIDTFLVDENGIPGNAIVNASIGTTPFGFAFDRHDDLIVSEAAGGAVDASSLSSYSINDDGSLQVISGAVPTTETAACWVVTSHNGRYAYTTNAGSSSISGYRINHYGALSLLDSNGVTATTGNGSAPIDMALTHNGRFLYALSSAVNGSIRGFRLEHDGGLKPIEAVSGLPTGVNGLAAY